jgi:hypothetical protein
MAGLLDESSYPVVFQYSATHFISRIDPELVFKDIWYLLFSETLSVPHLISSHFDKFPNNANSCI